MLKFFLTYSLLFLIVSSSYSQNCSDFYKNNCFPPKSNFIYKENSLSESFLFSSGEVHEIPFAFLLGIDYRITLCADPIFEDIIKFVIKGEEGNVIYDNSKENFNLNLEFSARKSQHVKFELMAPDLSWVSSDTVYTESCLGIFIEEMVSVKTGF